MWRLMFRSKKFQVLVSVCVTVLLMTLLTIDDVLTLTEIPSFCFHRARVT